LRDGLRKFGHQQVGHRLEQAIEMACWATQICRQGPFHRCSDQQGAGHGLVLPGSRPGIGEGRLEVKPVRELDIGEVVKRSGVPASTLRYYEQLGCCRRWAVAACAAVRAGAGTAGADRPGPGGRAVVAADRASLPPQRGCTADREALLAQADVLQRQIIQLQRCAGTCSGGCPSADAECGSFRKLLRAQQRMAGERSVSTHGVNLLQRPREIHALRG
jgi:hypothetical protein